MFSYVSPGLGKIPAFNPNWPGMYCPFCWAAIGCIAAVAMQKEMSRQNLNFIIYLLAFFNPLGNRSSVTTICELSGQALLCLSGTTPRSSTDHRRSQKIVLLFVLNVPLGSGYWFHSSEKPENALSSLVG